MIMIIIINTIIIIQFVRPFFPQHEEDMVPMFDGQLLKEVDLSKGECKLHECGLSVDNLGENLVLRPLCSDDYHKGKSLITHTFCSL